MHLWGSKLHAGYSIPLHFYLERSAIWGRCLKIRVQPYHNGYMTGGVDFLGGALEWFQRSCIIVTPCLGGGGGWEHVNAIFKLLQ